MARSHPTALYRLFDEYDVLVYVGITYYPERRFEKHRRTYWWKTVIRWDIEWHPNRHAAARAEKEAIREEWPVYNVQRPVGSVDWVLPPKDGREWVTSHPGYRCYCGHEPEVIVAAFENSEDVEWASRWECVCGNRRVGVTEGRIREIGHHCGGWNLLEAN